MHVSAFWSVSVFAIQLHVLISDQAPKRSGGPWEPQQTLCLLTGLAVRIRRPFQGSSSRGNWRKIHANVLEQKPQCHTWKKKEERHEPNQVSFSFDEMPFTARMVHRMRCSESLLLRLCKYNLYYFALCFFSFFSFFFCGYALCLLRADLVWQICRNE